MLKTLIAPGKVYSQNDTIYPNSVRFGVEVSYPVRGIFEPATKQYEASMDLEFLPNWFGVLEGGILMVDIKREDFEYYTNGHFFRTGINFNVLGNDALDDNDMVYIGIRYGYSKQYQGADNVMVSDGYWVEEPIITSVEKVDFNVHWGELIGGVKTELFTNLFMGWSLRVRLRMSDTDETMIKPYQIGGFGRGDNKTAFDFNYSIFYRIPF